MSKITLTNIGNLQDTATSATAINSNNATLTAAFDNTLSRDGTTPNQMFSTLDMNSNQVINLPTPATGSSALRLQDLSTFVGAGTVTNIPSGGTTGQVISKTSNTNYQVGWSNVLLSETSPNHTLTTGPGTNGNGTIDINLANPNTWTGAQSFANNAVALNGTGVGYTTLNTANTSANNYVATLPANTGTIAELNMNQTWTGTNTYNTNGIGILGSSTGRVLLNSGNTSATDFSVTIQPVADTLVSRTTTDTLTNKTLTSPVISTIVNTGTLTLPTSTDTLVGRATTDTLTNKTLTSPVISTISNTGTLTLPTSTDTLVGRATTDTLTNKTLTSPVISTISNTGTLTLPTSTDTLVGRATTDTLTNKTISGSNNTLSNIALSSLTPQPVTTLNGQASAVVVKGPPGGRLTLTSATPVLTTTVTGATTVYYTPYVHDWIMLYDGTNFVPTTTAEISQLTTDTTKSPAAVVANSNYDIFVWNDSGTIRATRGPAWTSDSARGTGAGTTELVLQNGVRLNKNAITNGPAASRGTYVGSIRSNGSSQIDYILGGNVTAGWIGVFNYYNRIQVIAEVVDTGAGYSYTSSVVRQANAGAGTYNKISYLQGVDEDGVDASYLVHASPAAVLAAYVRVGIGLDSITAFSGQFAQVQNPAAQADSMLQNAYKKSTLGLGWHYVAALEVSDGTNAATFNGLSLGTLTLRMKA